MINSILCQMEGTRKSSGATSNESTSESLRIPLTWKRLLPFPGSSQTGKRSTEVLLRWLLKSPVFLHRILWLSSGTEVLIFSLTFRSAWNGFFSWALPLLVPR